MAINVSQTYSQAARLNEYATQLRNIRSKLINDRDLLNMYWQSKELKYINQAIGDIDKKLLQVASMLEGLNSSIRSAAQDIHREEEAARIAAEREAARRREEARQAAAREAAAREEARQREAAMQAEAARQAAAAKQSSQSILEKLFGNFLR